MLLREFSLFFFIEMTSNVFDQLKGMIITPLVVQAPPLPVVSGVFPCLTQATVIHTFLMVITVNPWLCSFPLLFILKVRFVHLFF